MDIRFERGLTLSEAIDLLTADDDIVGDIFIQPPEPETDTDEDSGDEDGGGLIDNLTSRQLLANAEIVLPNNERIDALDDPEVTEDRQLPTTSTSSASATNAQNSNMDINSSACKDNVPDIFKEWLNFRRGFKPEWIENADFDIERPSCFPTSDYSKFKNMSIVDISELFLDPEIIDLLVTQSQYYALFLNCPDPKITSDEMRCFIAILYVTGYNPLPSKRHYWDSNDDMKNSAVFNAMRRDRFLQICRFLHCVDNTKIDKNDKAWKIRPLMELIKKRCLDYYVPQENLTYDESMVKYFGRHSCKQFIRGKPIRFGYKIWCLNSKDGYLINFDLYQGKNKRTNVAYEQYFGKCSAPLLLLLNEIPEEKKQLNYTFFLDNLFSNPALFCFLNYQGYSAIGTICDKRLPKGFPLTDKKSFKKKERGYFENTIERNDGLLYVRWHDNAVVTVLSSKCGTQEVSYTKRYSQKQKRHIMVTRPKAITKYCSHMGGTDQMDQNVAAYRIGIRSKKWYWPLITWLLDVAMTNSWVLYNNSREKKVSHLEFRREVTNVYLKRYGILPKGAGRLSASLSSTDSRISNDIRYDRLDHFVQKTEENKKRRCAGTGCKSVVRTMCLKCNVGLCIDCFVSFHTKK